MTQTVVRLTLFAAFALAATGGAYSQTSQYIPPNALDALNQEMFGAGPQQVQPQQQEPIIFVKQEGRFSTRWNRTC
ncbi:hypothetical protein HS125_12590 [bacterium]|nr:hypothetical protein [bacterium]